MANACGIGGDAFWLIWDAGRRRRAGAQRVGPLVRPGRRRGAPSVGPRAAPASRRPDDHGARAPSGRGATHTTATGGCRGRTSSPRRSSSADGGFPAWDGFIESVETSASRFAARARPDRGLVARSTARTADPGGPASASACRPSPRRSTRIADGGLGRVLRRRDSPQHQARGARRPPARRSAATTSRPTARPGRSRSASTTAGVRVTTHPPNSSGFVALEILNILEQFEPPPPDAFAAGPAPTCAGSTSGSRRRSWRWPTATRTSTDPETHRGAARAAPRQAVRRPSWRPAIDPAPGRPTARGAGSRAAAGRSGSASSTATGNAVSLIESNYMGFGSGVVDPATGIPYQNRGLVLQPRPGPPQRARPGQADAPHAACRGCSSATGGRGSWPARWAATPSRRSTPRSCRPSSTAASTSRRRSATPRWFVEPDRALRAARRRSASSRASGPGCSTGSAGLGHPVAPSRAVRQRRSATATRSSSSTAARPTDRHRSRPRPTRAAPGLPARLVARPRPRAAAGTPTARRRRDRRLYSPVPVAAALTTRPADRHAQSPSGRDP